MRTAREILELIRSTAEDDRRIVAALLLGSRANTGIGADKYQDYDVIYVVDDISEFIGTPRWVEVFGEPVLLQTPDDMVIPVGSSTTGGKPDRFAYLMLFADYVRIDLTLVERDALAKYVDTPASVLIDKAGGIGEAIDRAAVDQFLVTKPTQKEFSDCCNEFWWVSTYVVKGLLRAELLYAKRKLERPLRDMLLLMLSWKVGAEADFTVNLGSEYRFLKQYLSEDEWSDLADTYPPLSQRGIWDGLTAMTDLFERTEKAVAKKLGYSYCQAEIDAANQYADDNFAAIANYF